MAITAPIWQDTYYTTEASSLVYSIEKDGEIIFSGKAYKMPNADTIRININKICQNYLNCNIEELLSNRSSETIMTNYDAYVTFNLKDSNGYILETYTFFYDWSYEPFNWDGSTRSFSRPINGKTTVGMLKPKTYYNNGYTYTSLIDGEYSKSACGDYALYYVNAYGGWDAFLIEGTVVKSDSITQHNYNKSFNNNTIEFEEGRYISEISTSYVLHTGWLSDYESHNLVKNLLGSNTVYLHNLNDGTISPVTITDTKNTYKTYQNQGRKLVNYTINIKTSQNRIRK